MSLTGLKSGCWLGSVPMETLEENLSLAFSSFWRLPAFFNPWALSLSSKYVPWTQLSSPCLL